jgi:hypothetical protein
MDALAVDSLMNEALLAELGEGLDGVADRLATAHDAWARCGADPATTDYLAELLGELGWWRGRIDAALGPPSGGF